MSLVNDALKKARMEAARANAANRNFPYPLRGRGEQARTGLWLAALSAAVLLAAITGLVLYRAGRQSALEAQVAEQTLTSATRSAASEGSAPDSVEPPQTAARPEPSRVDPEKSPPTPEDPPRPTSQRSQRQTPTPEPRPAPAPDHSRHADPGRPPEGRSANRVAARSASPESPAPLESPAATAEPKVPQPTSAGASAELSAAPQAEASDAIAAADEVAPEFLQRAEIPGIGPVELGGIAWSGDRPFALVNGRVVRPGDTVSGLLVDDIQPNTVRLRGDNGIMVFRLK